MKRFSNVFNYLFLFAIIHLIGIKVSYGQTCSGSTPAEGTFNGSNITGTTISPSNGKINWYTGGTVTVTSITISANSTLVIKTGSFVTVSASTTIPSGNTIYIESGASLTVQGSLTIQGNFINLGTLTITGNNFLQVNGGAVYNDGTITATSSYIHFNATASTFLNGGSATFTYFNWQIAVTPAAPFVCMRPGSIFNLLSSNSGSVVAGTSSAFQAGGLFQYNATDISSNSTCTPANPARVNFLASFVPTNGVVWGPTGLFANNANISIVGSTPSGNGTGTGFGVSTRVTSGTGYSAAAPQNFFLNTFSPAPTTTGSYFEYCLNSSVPLAAMASGINLLWYTSATGGTGSSIAPTVNTSSTGLQTFWVSQNVTGSCEGPRSPININVISTAANGTITAANNGPVCAGNMLSLSAVGTGIASWSWSGPNSYTTTAHNPTVSATATAAMAGTYYVIATQTTGNCLNGASTTVVVNGAATSQPGAFTTSTATVCKNQNNVIYTVPAVTGATSYTWTYSGNGASFSSTTNTVSINFSLAATSGTLSVTASNACGASIARTMSVTVDAGIFQVSTINMIAYYKFNGNANDEMNNDQGTLQGAPTSVADRFGNANSAYSFNGTSQYVTTANQYTSPTNLNDFSFSVWFQTTTLTGGKIIEFGSAATGGSGNYDRQVYMANSGQLYITVNPGGTGHVLNTPLGYNDGIWHNVIGTVSAANGMRLYADGILIASDAAATTGQSFSGYWRMAYDNTGAWTNAPSSQFFKGNLDDVMIFHRELTSAEVTTAYNAPDGAASNSPVCIGGTLNLTSVTLTGATYGWAGPNSFSANTRNTTVTSMSAAKTGAYTLTVTSGTCIYKGYTLGNISNNLGPNIFMPIPSGTYSHYDLDGNANDDNHYNQGSFIGTPSFVTDRFGVSSSAALFDGSTQYMATSAPYVNPVDFTISCWFKTTTTSGGKLLGFAAAQTGTGGSFDRHIYMNNAGQLYFGVYASGVKILNTPAGGVVYNDNVWHNVVGTLSSTAGVGLSFYVDGVLVATDPTTTSADPFTGYWRAGYGDLSGSWPSQPTSLFFNGTIDDIYIYTRAITASEVTILYSASGGVSNNGPVCVGSTVTLSSTAATGTTLAWSGAASLSPSAAAQNPTFVYNSTNGGGYTLVGTNTSTGCIATAYTFVSPNTTTPGQWTGVAGTNWQTPNNWCGGALPSSTTVVTIPAVTNLPVNSGGSANAKSITINSSASLTNTSTGIMNIYGNVTNNGTFTDNSIYSDPVAINFVGTTAQTLSGTGTNTLSNVTLTNSAGLTLSSTVTVNGILTLTSGTLASGGNLNQNLYNGAIAGTGSGLTSGNIRFFKYIYGDRYHYMSTPIPGKTTADWNDNVTTSGHLYSYNETIKDTSAKVGWTAVANGTTLGTMTGYSLFFPRYTYFNTIDVSGTYTHNSAGSIASGTLTNTKTTVPVISANADGWNLLGNPYPSTVDWSSGSITKTGIDNAIYMWDGRTNRYAYFVSGTGTNGGTQYIGSMQGFFVKVSAAGGTGSLTIPSTARVTSTLKDVWRTEEDVTKILRLTVANGTDADETVVRFKDDATEDFDAEFDAYKLTNDSNVPSVFSVSAVANYAINSLPSDLVHKTIPLQLNAVVDATYSWTADLSGFNNGDVFFLEDRLMGTYQNLSDNPTYSVTLSKGNYAGRFYLQYANGRQSTVTENTSANNNTSGIEIGALQQNVFLLFTNQSSGTANIAVFDALGKPVYNSENATIDAGRIDFALPDISNGVYVVKVQTAAASKTQQVFLQK
ncbi:MAG: C-terminal target protein [Chitinophagaceae bacterium]|nr:C-terminal target protein [Chitinophagaceae bacterium]